MENDEPYNLQEDLDAIDLAVRMLGSDDGGDGNLGDEMEVGDLINAHLEDLLRREDEGLFEGPTNEDDNENDPVERLRWFPFRNKMVC
ncbi:hypothetical protein MJO29_004246 [Puccinia striiformis f. sp. tritici]|nr:hypothetical protein MJO29_004246 [Puccinia striiformis f. sp. tritici]